jgi:hypothetical protein
MTFSSKQNTQERQSRQDDSPKLQGILLQKDVNASIAAAQLMSTAEVDTIAPHRAFGADGTIGSRVSPRSNGSTQRRFGKVSDPGQAGKPIQKQR